MTPCCVSHIHMFITGRLGEGIELCILYSHNVECALVIWKIMSVHLLPHFFFWGVWGKRLGKICLLRHLFLFFQFYRVWVCKILLDVPNVGCNLVHGSVPVIDGLAG